ncbi:MAG: M48 family metalloprotease [Alphaproteobacteria bacterium]|nr:M48 family metalloprotease [Alphaproteobacteria bacterium]
MNNLMPPGRGPLSRRRFLGGAAAAGCLCGLGACSVNPATGRSSFTAFMSPEEEIRVGDEEHPKVLKSMGGEYADARLSGYVTHIGRRLAQVSELQGLPYSFTILNSTVVNALALPGGRIYVTRGLLALANNEAELAGVMAHEVGHVNARHSAERHSQTVLGNIGATALGIAGSIVGIGGIGDLAQMGTNIYLQAFSREQELEADTLGVRYLARAGYDVGGVGAFLSTLREHSIVRAKMDGRPEESVDEYDMMATHPRTIDRVQKAIEASQGIRQANPKVGRAEYLARINGLAFGDDPTQGVVKGTRFVHPELRFEFTVPDGFVLSNNDRNVVAKSSAGAVITFDIAPMKRPGPVNRYLVEEWAAGETLRSVETLSINGMEAATGATRVQTRTRGTVDLRLVAARREPDSVYRFAFLTPTTETARLTEELKRTTYSLRALSPSEAKQVAALRLIVVPVRPDDTDKSLAAGLPFGEFNGDWFRLLNGLKPGQSLQPGTEIKTVAG